MPYARILGIGYKYEHQLGLLRQKFLFISSSNSQTTTQYSPQKWPTFLSTSLSMPSSVSFRKLLLNDTSGGLPLVTMTLLTGLSNRGKSQELSLALSIVIIPNFRLDLHENTEKNLVTASFDFPGVSKEDIQIDVASGKLTVSTEKKQSTEHSEDGYTTRERRFGKFSRTLQLPQGIKVIHRIYSRAMPVALTINLKDDEISATMENGVLTITFPKAAPELAPKRIGVA